MNPIARVDQSGNILEKYVYGIRSNIPEYIIKDGRNYKVISDHLGSPVRVRDDNYQVVKSIKYDTFGNVINESGAFEIPFRFAGGLYDEDTKLIRFGVRDYDPEIGRWTTKEPLGFSGSRNWYVYAGNDGVNFVDVNGLLPIQTNKNGNQDLTDLEKISPRIKRIINTLIRSKIEIIICDLSKASESYRKKYKTSSDCIGGRCIIYYDQYGATWLADLAHELGHAWNFVNNKIYSDKYEELLPIQLENIINRYKKRTQRTSYGYKYSYGLEATHSGYLNYLFEAK